MSNTNRLEDLFYMFANQGKHDDTEKSKTAKSKLWDMLERHSFWGNAGESKVMLDIEELICDLCNEYEAQGFAEGYTWAMSLVLAGRVVLADE